MSKKVKLKRELRLFEITVSGVGMILGAGIYALIGKAAGLAGNAVWLSFVFAAFIAVFTGLSYAELSSMFPKDGAEYEYAKNAFGKKLAFIIGWLIIFSGIIVSATVALGFGGYFNALFKVPVVPSAFALIIALSALLFYSTKESMWFEIISTLIESAGLIIIIFIALPHIGKVNYLLMPQGLNGVFQASALVFFAYIGFEGIVKLSEETKTPEKTIPRGLLLSILITLILYVLVAIAAVSIMGWEKLGSSEAPLADLAFSALGSNAFLILTVIALFATSNTVLGFMFCSSRIIYGMANSSTLPRFLAKVHTSRRTPWVAIIVTMLLSLLFIFAGNIVFLADVANFTVFITYIVINAVLIMLRYKEPLAPRPFKVPLAIGKFPLIPLFGLIFSVFMLFQLEWKVILTGIALIAAGSIFYLLFSLASQRKALRLQ